MRTIDELVNRPSKLSSRSTPNSPNVLSRAPVFAFRVVMLQPLSNRKIGFFPPLSSPWIRGLFRFTLKEMASYWNCLRYSPRVGFAGWAEARPDANAVTGRAERPRRKLNAQLRFPRPEAD